MCVFCAAVPAALAVGVKVQRKQTLDQRAEQAAGEPASRPVLPAAPVTVLVVTGLVAASVFYHTRLGV